MKQPFLICINKHCTLYGEAQQMEREVKCPGIRKSGKNCNLKRVKVLLEVEGKPKEEACYLCKFFRHKVEGDRLYWADGEGTDGYIHQYRKEYRDVCVHGRRRHIEDIQNHKCKFFERTGDPKPKSMAPLANPTAVPMTGQMYRSRILDEDDKVGRQKAAAKSNPKPPKEDTSAQVREILARRFKDE